MAFLSPNLRPRRFAERTKACLVRPPSAERVRRVACPFGWRIFFLFSVLLGMGLSAARGQAVSREYQLKAVFLYNFVQFTEWPTNSFSSTNAPVVIGVLGTNPFGQFIEETVKGEKMKGRSLVVQHYRRVEDI